ncbi:MAG: DUF4244 domain-containing protein [Aeromicrobium sp.]
MTPHPDHGMTTSEYAVGTVGACTIALVLYRLGTDGTWLDHVMDLIREALAWRNIFDRFPRLGLR